MRGWAIYFSAVALLITACSKSEIPKLVPPKSFERQQFKQDVSSVNFNDPLVDILLVIDGSGSMSSHQQNVQSNLDKFLDRLTAAKLDYHIAVTISGYVRETKHDWLYPNRLDKMNSGLFHTNNSSDTPPYFVTRNTPNALDILKDRVRVGISNDATETFFGPVLDAIEHYKNGTPNNAQFFRDKAYFVPIFVTDAGEQTRIPYPNYMDPAVMYQSLIEFKGDAALVLPYSVHILSSYNTSPPPGCFRDSGGQHRGIPLNIEDFVRMGGGDFYDLCAKDFGMQLSNLAEDLTRKIAVSFELAVVPDPTTIEVYYGSVLLPNNPDNGWVYMPETNSIYLGPNVESPHPDAQIRVEFAPVNEFRN